MKMEVVTFRRQTGIGKESKKPYDFWIVGGVVKTKQGEEMAEVVIPGEHAQPERGKVYELEVEVYPDREKRLSFRVVGLRAISVATGEVSPRKVA